MNPATNRLAGPLVQLLGRADLLRHAGAHHHHPVAQRHRLGLVVRDVDGGGAQPVLQPGDLAAHLHPQLGVEVGQRLVHQERLGIAHDRAAHRDPLTLTAGQLRGLAVQKVGQVKDFRGLLDLLGDLGLLHLRQRQREGDVLPHGHVRVERVGLEHHRDVAVLGRLLVHPLAADAQLARRDILQPGNHVQRGGLSAAGRADQDDELAVGDGERQVLHGRRAVGVTLGHLVQHNLGHRRYPFTAPDVNPATIRRWKIRTKMMIGIVITIAPAAIDPVGSSNCELPVKFAIATGAVIAALGGRQRQRQQQVVPGEDEHQDRRGDDARRRQRRDHLAERLSRCGAVHLGRLLQIPRDLPEERRQRVDRQRQRERDVRDDQPGPGVEQPDAALRC